MDELIKTLSQLNSVVEHTTSMLLEDRITKTNAKNILITEISKAINSFALLDIDAYIYIYPCTHAIREITYATNAEQVIAACLQLNLWAAEKTHKLNESEA